MTVCPMDGLFFYCHYNEVIDMAEQKEFELEEQACRAVLELIQCIAEEKKTG